MPPARLHRCPDRNAKISVLKEMIFPNCEKLGQTIIFVRTKDAARELHRSMEADGYKCTSITVSGHLHRAVKVAQHPAAWIGDARARESLAQSIGKLFCCFHDISGRHGRQHA